jgi:hypothetical protein
MRAKSPFEGRLLHRFPAARSMQEHLVAYAYIMVRRYPGALPAYEKRQGLNVQLVRLHKLPHIHTCGLVSWITALARVGTKKN